MSVRGTADQLSWMRSRDSLRIYLIEVELLVMPGSTTEDIYLVSEPYEDTEGDIYEVDILPNGLQMTQRLPRTFTGGAQQSGGSIFIDNTDGKHDTWLATTRSWSGRPMTIYGIDPTDSTQDTRAEYQKMFVGYTSTIERVGESVIKVTFNHFGYHQNVDVWEHQIGTPVDRDIIMYGRCFRVQPVLKDESKLRYYVGSTDIESIQKVYIRGVEQTATSDYATIALLDAASSEDISTGEYGTCLAEGQFRLGGTPDGIVTIDVRGDKDGGASAVSSASGIAELLGDQSPASGYRAPDITFYSSSMTQLDLDCTYTFGIVITEAKNINDVLNELWEGAGIVWWYDNYGELQAEVFDEPGTTEIGTIDQDLDAISDVRMRYIQPTWRVEVRAKKNWVQQTSFPSSVAASKQESFQKEWPQIYVFECTTTPTEFQNAQVIVRELVALGADGEDEAERVRDLFCTSTNDQRKIYSLRVHNRVGAFGLHETWELVHDRIAPSGINLRVIAAVDNYLENYTDVELWG